MKINVELEHLDIANAPIAVLADFVGSLQAMAKKALDADAETPYDEKSGKPAQNTSEGQDAAKKMKADTSTAAVKKSGETPSVKATEAKAEKTASAKIEKKETEKPAPAPKAKEEPAKTEPAAEETAPEGESEKIDRAAVLTLAKQVTTSGKAKEVKALLGSFGIEKLSALPDDKLAEFAEKLKAL